MGLRSRAVALPRAVADRVVQSRSRLPRWVNRSIDHVADNPDGLLGRMAARSLGAYGPNDVPAPTEAPHAAHRVYIGPTNYAAQGWAWARALDAAPDDVAAKNMSVAVPGGFSFATDTEVPVPVYSNDRGWQERELAAVSGFSHVLYEAERPLFGRLFSRDVEAEIHELVGRGLSVALLCHGTDIRLPSRHREDTPWSPYRDRDVYHDRHERLALRNRRLLDTLRLPVFVSTPDLLADVPYGRWCPVVVNPRAWASSAAPFGGDRPVVVHVPSQSTVKGTQLVRPAMAGLHGDGVVEYREITGVPSARMPETYAAADIVLDQFRLGSYGVAACEAMAAGRVVVGHVTEEVRRIVRCQTGSELPVVEATPETVAAVVADLVADPERSRVIGQAGAAFVSAVHDGTRSARVLLDEWIGDS